LKAGVDVTRPSRPVILGVWADACPRAPLPSWLARRRLRPGEVVTWVRGPRFSPRWERFVTHPGLFVVALLLALACVGVARALAGSWAQMPLAPPLVAVGLLVGSIYVLAISNAYFTRLVVTNLRVFILQGHELCRSWGLDDLPRSLVRYGRREGKEVRSVDVDALQTMLGGASEHFSDAKTIRAFGKQLDAIQERERDRR
jgi:hypothetical protein